MEASVRWGRVAQIVVSDDSRDLRELIDGSVSVLRLTQSSQSCRSVYELWTDGAQPAQPAIAAIEALFERLHAEAAAGRLRNLEIRSQATSDHAASHETECRLDETA
jgi:hypothetical protein